MPNNALIDESKLRKLCETCLGRREDEVPKWLTYVRRELNTAEASSTQDGGFQVETFLNKEGNRTIDRTRFLELQRTFFTRVKPVRKDAVLQFLAYLSEEKKKSGHLSGHSFLTTTANASLNTTLSSVVRQDPHQRSAFLNGSLQPNSLISCADPAMPGASQSRRDSTADTVISNVSYTVWPRAAEGNFSERSIIQELLFAFQGIGGQIFKDDFGDGTFRITSKVSAPLLYHAAHLAELGSLHVRVQRMVNSVPLVGAPSCLTALVTAMKAQLNEFAKLVAQLEAQLHQDEEHLSLLRVKVMTASSQAHMRWLVTVAEQCKDKKGGALLSALHGLMQHGDPRVQAWLEPLLSAASRPFYVMLAQWLKEGHIDDPYSEFFVAIDSGASRDDFWHHKFSIREAMRPTFISASQANMVLATGKSVAFLHDLCGERSEPLKWAGMDSALAASSNLPASLLWAVDGNLQAAIEAAHLDVSGRALAVMLDEGKLSLHLQALRRYLLLGQGDFVRQLMENLAPRLDKEAHEVYTHQLTPLLDSAIRSTLAQHDDPDVLSRLDVKLMQMSTGEKGWDVFSLRYCVDGPIAMIFTNEVNTKYLSLFNALWRAKRMEWVLCNLWQRQTTSARMLRKIPELIPVMREMMLLVSEMNQLVRQMQYYLMFECVECQWSELQQAVTSAPSLDHLIRAHDKFLSSVLRRALLDDSSGPLLAQLRMVYNTVLGLEAIETQLAKGADAEFQRRNELEREEERLEREGQYGGCGEKDAAEAHARSEFEKFIRAREAQLRSLATSYQDMVKSFLLSLASHPNEDLQFLSYRLDFNEHYKKSDKRLSTPLTLDYRRRSGRLDASIFSTTGL